MAAVAAWIDLGVVAYRFMPGFERRLSGARLRGVYVAFAAGLAAAGRAPGRRAGT